MDKTKGINRQLLGKTGEYLVAAYLNSWGISSVFTGDSDFGEDLICDILINQDKPDKIVQTNLTFRVQVKTTEDIFKKNTIRKVGNKFALSLKSSLLRKWENSYFPVIVVIWDKKRDDGYWCIAEEQITGKEGTHGNTTIYFEYKNKFKDSKEEIIEYIKMYYDDLLKTSQGNYICKILPFYMPNYKYIEPIEYYKYIEPKYIKKLNFNYLPSFISSYNFSSIKLENITCIEISIKSNSLEAFIDELENIMIELNQFGLEKDEWISFLVSPISIITSEGVKLSTQMTDWISYSLIEEKLITDYYFTFPIHDTKFLDKYQYTEKTRVFSIDNNYFINHSGKFAIEIFAKTKELILDGKSRENILEKYKQNLCLWDISSCKEEEKNYLYKWCQMEGHNVQIYRNAEGIIIISNPAFSIGDFGTLFIDYPLVKGKSIYCDYGSRNFIQSIPFGNPVEKSILDKFYLENFNIDLNNYRFNEKYNCFDNTEKGFLLNHRKREVVFTLYTENYKPGLEEAVVGIKKRIQLQP